MPLRRVTHHRRALSCRFLHSCLLVIGLADCRPTHSSFVNLIFNPTGVQRSPDHKSPASILEALGLVHPAQPAQQAQRRVPVHSPHDSEAETQIPVPNFSPASDQFFVTQKLTGTSQPRLQAPGSFPTVPASTSHAGSPSSAFVKPERRGYGPSSVGLPKSSPIPSSVAPTTGVPEVELWTPSQGPSPSHQGASQRNHNNPDLSNMSYEWNFQHGSAPLGPAPAPSPVAVPPPAAAPVSNETYVIEVDATKEEVFASQSILLQIFMLGIAFVVGHMLRRKKFYYIHEASAALLIGLAAGTIGNLYYPQEGFRDWLVFKEDIFMLFLLPPIIFESGFSLQVKPFFDNFGAILVFSLLGTFIAAMVTGVLVYIGGFLFLMYKLTFLESLVFGSLISATDPVTVLAIFQELGADTNLYALVFGESVLNDAMAITMYRTLMSIIANPDASRSLASAVRYAGVTLVGSMSIGMGTALVCALLFKYAGLAVYNLHNLECCLIVLFPYISYLVAEGLAMSGIVAILFCGVVMKRYTFPNLSDMAQTLSAGFFQLISSLAETFTFIYMGSEIALGEEQSWGHVNFIFFSIVIIGVARAANVFPCAHLVNLFRPPSKQIPDTHQKALWCSGLRGAMAFALALQAVHDLPNESHAKAIFTTTIAIVMVTVLVLGGSTATILEKLEVSGEKFKRNPEEELPLAAHFSSSYRGSSNPEDEERQRLKDAKKDQPGGVELDLAIPETLREQLGHLRESASFENLDSKYIRPFFTTNNEVEKAASSPGRFPSRPVRTNSKTRMVNSH